MKIKTSSMLLTAAFVMSLFTGCGQKQEEQTVSSIYVTNSADATLSVSDNDETEKESAPEKTNESNNVTEPETESEAAPHESQSESEPASEAPPGESEEETKENKKENNKQVDKETNSRETDKPSKKTSTEATTTETLPIETTSKITQQTEAPSKETQESPDRPSNSTDNKPSVTVTKVTATVSGSYYVGSALSASAFKVTAYFSDGTVLTNPPGFTASPLTLTGESNVITVSYKGASTTVTVKAAKKEPPKTPETPQAPENKPENKPETKPETPPETPKAPEKTEVTPVKMTATPTREVYYHGDPINFDTVTVTVTMSDGSVLTNPAGVTFDEPTFRAPGGAWYAYYKDLICPIRVIIDVCPDSDFSKEVALEAFKLQNEMRAEAGSPPLTWSDDLYEVAKKCAKICGDNDTIDHDLTFQYREYTYIGEDGYEQEGIYAENLSMLGAGNAPQFIAAQSIKGIKGSPGHYGTATSNSGPNEQGAIAAYRVGNDIFISYVFHHVSYDY